MDCQCRICIRHRKFQEWRKQLPDEAKAFADELYCSLNTIEDDLDYATAVINGSWPTADEVILNKRKAKKTKGDMK